MPSGLFVTLEGCEGSGKSSQARRLRGSLNGLGIPVTVVREPGGTALGDKLRRILKFSSIPLTPEAELLLFNASRAELVRQVIVPALKNGHVVICDRFTDSTVAYQGYGRGLSLDIVRSVNTAAAGDLKPDITILLDISPEASDSEVKKAYRKMASKFHPDKVHHLGNEFQKMAEEKFKSVNDAYQQIKKEMGMK